MEESDSFFMGAINKIIKNESVYYLLDSEKSKSIFAYNDHGNYIAKYYARGGGPREYASILDFDIDTIRDEIVILCAPSKLIITDLRLSFKEEVSLNGDYYDRMVIVEDNIFLFSYYNEIIGKYDRNGKLVNKTHIPNKLIKGNIFHPQPVFYKMSDKCLMQSPGDDLIYKEENGEWIEYLYLDYENRIGSMKLYTQTNEEEITFEDKISNPLPYIKYFFEYGEKEYFVYLLGVLHYLSDRENNFLFSELPGRSFNYHKGHLYAWEYLSNFNLENPVHNQQLRNIEIKTSGSKQINELGDGILLIDYVFNK
jgi:hypothetical protein